MVATSQGLNNCRGPSWRAVSAALGPLIQMDQGGWMVRQRWDRVVTIARRTLAGCGGSYRLQTPTRCCDHQMVAQMARREQVQRSSRQPSETAGTTSNDGTGLVPPFRLADSGRALAELRREKKKGGGGGDEKKSVIDPKVVRKCGAGAIPKLGSHNNVLLAWNESAT